MRKVKVITALSLAVLMLVSLSNTVSAEATNGPPVGEQKVEFNPTNPVINKPVMVTIMWWIDETEGRCNKTYMGPFNLSIDLIDPDGDEVADWAIHKDTTEIFTFQADKDTPYTYVFTETLPGDIGKYRLDVQIVATGDVCKVPVGKSGNSHPLLVASEGGSFTSVPEFSTIAIPVAAILGLLFFFNHRKRKKS